MSRIDELIAELAPDGVGFSKLWQLTSWDKRFNAVERHKQPRVLKYNYLLAGDLRPLIVDGGNVKILTTNTSDFWTTEELSGDLISEGEVVAIPWGGNANVQYCKGKFLTADNRIAVSNDTKLLDTKFLYYFLQSRLDVIGSFYRGSGIKHPSMTQVLDMVVPVPPVVVQREIVGILDCFAKLEAELKAELEARRRQYECYLDLLVDSNAPGTQWLPIDRICEISRGRVISRDYLRNHPGEFPVYSSQTQNNGVFGYIDTYANECESVTWTTDGANAGSVFHHVDERFNITNVCGLLEVKDTSMVMSKFVYYQLLRRARGHVSEGMGNPKLMARAMARIAIPVPPVDDQKRVVAILDKFDALVNDQLIGLPAELKARRRQYEHYRDRLLTFSEAT